MTPEQPTTQETISEKITSAAIRYEGQFYTGRNHGEAVIELERLISHYDPSKIESGFLTSTNRFVSHDEAVAIAKKAQPEVLIFDTISTNLLGKE
ncbi:MAG: hypothetical protein WCF94_02305 [bacterium]